MHKQSLLEEDECTQASHLHLTVCLLEEDECTQASHLHLTVCWWVEGSCSPESTDGGADDEVLEERRLKNALGRAERTHKLPPDQHQGTCPAEKFDHQGTMNPRGPETCLFVGSKNTSWCQSEQLM